MKLSLTRGAARLVALLSSYGLACAIFLLLLALTYLGTLEQIEHGLFHTQEKFFNSWVLVHEFFGFLPVALPGAYLLLALLSVNLLLGGLLRMRKGWRQAGVLVVHAGILLLLGGAFITFHFSSNGYLRLYPDEADNVVRSYHEWEVAVTGQAPGAPWREFVIPQHAFEGRGPRTRWAHPDLPFELALGGFAANTRPRPATGGDADGFRLETLPRDKKQELNVAGLYAVAHAPDAAPRHMVLWGLQRGPATIEAGGATWMLDLRKRQWRLPFSIALQEFSRAVHPGTNMPKAFSSRIVCLDGGVEQQALVSMNQPFRHGGYIFYQSSWGPQDAPPGTPLFSVFAVSRNPADQFPLYACILISLGMALHFAMRLSRYLAREGEGRA